MSKEIIMNKRDLWHSQVANLNFELDENELVAEALSVDSLLRSVLINTKLIKITSLDCLMTFKF